MKSERNAIGEASAQNVEQLLHWAATVRSADIPGPVFAKAARVLADDMAAMIGARDEPEVKCFHERITQRSRAAEATLWRGGRVKVDAMWAGGANATAGDWLELDEGYRPTPCHAGLYVLPALLACAEADGLALRDVLRSLAVSYEVVTRVARAWVPRAVTMQAHGRYAAVGAACGVGVAMRLEPAMLVSAVGAAATLVGPAPRNHLQQGVLVRNAWPASGALNGMLAVEWAQCGIGGAAHALHDVYGTVLGGDGHPERLVQDLGASWAILDGYTKTYACCQHLHSAVEATLALWREGVRAPQTVAIDVECHPLALSFSDPAPRTSLGAKFSLPHAIASALATGSAGVAAFGASSLGDAAIARLRPLVSARTWPGSLQPPHDRPARVTVRLADGSTRTAECLSAEGSPDRPLPPDAWRDKLRELAEPVYPRIIEEFERIVRLDEQRLQQTWREVAADLTRP